MRRLQQVNTAVGHGDQRQFFANFSLAVLTLAEHRHVRNLTGETTGASLAAGVRVHLGIQHNHADWLTGSHQTRQVLEADVHHRAVATHGDNRRAQFKFIVGELVPIELGEFLFGLLGVVVARQFLLGATDCDKAIRHLAHVAFKNADRNRRCVLEQVVDPWEWVRVVRVSTRPHRRATRRVGEAQWRPT